MTLLHDLISDMSHVRMFYLVAALGHFHPTVTIGNQHLLGCRTNDIARAGDGRVSLLDEMVFHLANGSASPLVLQAFNAG